MLVSFVSFVVQSLVVQFYALFLKASG